MLDKVKLALRLTSTSFDSEITDLINACKKDLSTKGVKMVVENDPLIARAIVLYCKGNFGNDPNQIRFEQSYQALRDSLSLAGDYSG